MSHKKMEGVPKKKLPPKKMTRSPYDKMVKGSPKTK